MSLAVVDASVLVVFYAVQDHRREVVAARLASGATLFAPAHVDAEIAAALRGLSRATPALDATVPGALRHLAGFPLRRMPIAPLLQRIWELRDNPRMLEAYQRTLARMVGFAGRGMLL